jgi:hypothetical protein
MVWTRSAAWASAAFSLRGRRAAPLHPEHRAHHHQAVLDPMVDLPRDETLVVERPLLLEREAQRVRERLQERHVVRREGARVAAVGLEHAVGLAVAADEDVDRPHHPVLGQEPRRAEPALLPEVVRDHRLAGAEGVARRAFDVPADARMAHEARRPAHASAQQERALAAQGLDHLGEAHAQAIGRHAAGLHQNEVDLVAPQGEAAELGHERLLREALFELLDRARLACEGLAGAFDLQRGAVVHAVISG